MRDILKSTVFTEKETAATQAESPSPGVNRGAAAISLTSNSIFPRRGKIKGKFKTNKKACKTKDIRFAGPFLVIECPSSTAIPIAAGHFSIMGSEKISNSRLTHGAT